MTFIHVSNLKKTIFEHRATMRELLTSGPLAGPQAALRDAGATATANETELLANTKGLYGLTKSCIYGAINKLEAGEFYNRV
jgi:hypothetical protein